MSSEIDAEMIAQIIATSEEKDEVLVGYYLDNAKEIVLNQLYPFDEQRKVPVEIPVRYFQLTTRIALYLLAKAGADGESVHIENGIHRHYGANDVPPDLLRQIKPKAVVL